MNQVALKVIIKVVQYLNKLSINDIGILCLYKEFKYKISKEL